MFDALMLALLTAAFAGGFGYVRACEILVDSIRTSAGGSR
jgi:hypothetical protein